MKKLTAALFIVVSVSIIACSSTKPDLVTKVQHPGTIHGLAALQQAIQSEISSKLFETTSVGVIVERLSDHQILFEKDSNRLFHPASTMKLLTSAIALKELGLGFKFKTRLAIDSTTTLADTTFGNIYVIGGGDPSFTSADLNEFVDALRFAGVKHIEGNIVCDPNIFDDLPVGNGWMWDDSGWWYSAPISGLSINENCAEISARPGKIGEPAVVNLVPETDYLQIINKSMTIDSITFQKIHADTTQKFERFNVERRWRERENIVDVTGMIGSWYSEDLTTVDIVNPPKYVGSLLKEACELNGISVTGEVVVDSVAANAQIVYTHSSDPLNELLPKMNKPSSNLFAESLMKTVGAKYQSPGTAERGIHALNQLLATWGEDTNAVRVADGCGISRYTLIKPSTLLRILVNLYADFSVRNEFIASLPIAGVDGTLSRRMRGEISEKIVHAKTGTLSGVTTLAGFTTDRDGNELAFAIMMSHFVGSSSRYRAVQDQICNIITSFSEQ